MSGRFINSTAIKNSISIHFQNFFASFFHPSINSFFHSKEKKIFLVQRYKSRPSFGWTRTWKLNRINKVHVSARFFADDRTVSAFLPRPLSRASDSEIPATGGWNVGFEKRTVRFRDTRRRRSLEIAIFSRDAFISRSVTFPWMRFPLAFVDSARGSKHRKIRKKIRGEMWHRGWGRKKKYRGKKEKKLGFFFLWLVDINENMKFNVIYGSIII